MKTRLIFINLTLLIVLNSCCFGTKENHLGNNIYLSEYDNVDRRILYKTEKCANTGSEIVPMTVLEISNNSEWIIVKSGNKRAESDFKYWVIKNNYDQLPSSEIIKKHTTEFNDYDLFRAFLIENKINLELNKID
ncbi:hypothetical protein SHK09_14895 [Polaribacter sp. PL03]|uniref:hypothetical protein n=1 Tax=Polaribacter sp. PL03 TaxID=3088353 RepID=UPI0029D161B2|nr:hypothetical protein [Polaribacter sp. PL03]MDX6748082.1 hypothetical protein [Polaribacter sp. PL03]